MRLRDNALARAAAGDQGAQAVIDAINQSGVIGQDREFAFIGFCPGGDISFRQDRKWIAEGICEFGIIESGVQHRRFAGIVPGDLLILKKREQFGETMRLYGHGRVSEVLTIGGRLGVQWNTDAGEIVIPLMGCNGTVDIRSIETVEAEAPQEFWDWLGFNG
ncbi:MAG: hypothetical protein J0I45_14905 [Bosea sp.]|nr:hypothetical protein [Bosea sp. (in: a-proteobacteria)]